MPTYECPTCLKTIKVEKKEDAPFRPFCCDRCKMVDLGRWFDGTYRISDPANLGDSESADGVETNDTG